MNLETASQFASNLSSAMLRVVASPSFYGQVASVAAALILAFILVRITRPVLARMQESYLASNTGGPFATVRSWLLDLSHLLWPITAAVALMAAAQMADAVFLDSRLVRIALGIAVIGVLLAALQRYIRSPQLKVLARWIGVPVAIIVVFGYFDEFTVWLDTLALQAGNIRISALAVLKAALFGGALFWLGRKSTAEGQKVIRRQQEVDVQTRELAAKALEIMVFCLVGLLLLNILGLDLTALAVFGGALGVGLGFGLQQIASSFISGVIILLERSLKVGDYIEMEDGSAGTLKEINMRSSTLATFDGKEIMLPNDRFITTRFTNWTKTDPLQRYEIKFAVSYDTDLRQVPPLVITAVAGLEGLLATPSPPSCELVDFGDKGAEFMLQYWVSGMESGPDKFGSDIRFLIWDALRNAGVSMPRPPMSFMEQPIASAPSAALLQAQKGKVSR